MDNNSIAILQDYQSSIDLSFKKMERLFNEAENADLSQKNLAMNNINSELKSIKYNIGLIKFEIANLKEESNVNKWNEIISQINNKHDSFKARLSQLKNDQNSNSNDDPLNIDAKIDALSSSELADFLMVYIEHQNWLVTEYRKIK